MQYHASWKMPSGLYCCQTRENLLDGSRDQSARVVFVDSVEPGFVGIVGVDWTGELLGPVQVGGVEMRVGDDY